MIYFLDVKEEQMEILIKFIYTGEARFAQEDLDALLEVADKLQIKGLANEARAKQSNENEPTVSENLTESTFDKVASTAFSDYSKSQCSVENDEETKNDDNAEKVEEENQVEIIKIKSERSSEQKMMTMQKKLRRKTRLK